MHFSSSTKANRENRIRVPRQNSTYLWHQKLRQKFTQWVWISFGSNHSEQAIFNSRHVEHRENGHEDGDERGYTERQLEFGFQMKAWKPLKAVAAVCTPTVFAHRRGQRDDNGHSHGHSLIKLGRSLCHTESSPLSLRLLLSSNDRDKIKATPSRLQTGHGNA